MDTIIALTTPPGRSGVAVLRVSGDRATDYLGRLIAEADPQMLPPRNLLLRFLYGEKGEVIDQALVSVMPGPNSFTGEDVVEIMCHGNPIIVDAVINRMIFFGARPARPGEFSRRAVEHGKVSLLQAEAQWPAPVAKRPSEQKRHSTFPRTSTFTSGMCFAWLMTIAAAKSTKMSSLISSTTNPSLARREFPAISSPKS